MILKCKLCGKDYVGARAKQSIRMHLQGAHTIKVNDVLKSEHVTIINNDGISVEVPKKVDNAMNEYKSPKTDWLLISEILKHNNVNAQFRTNLVRAKEAGFMEMNMRTGELKK